MSTGRNVVGTIIGASSGALVALLLVGGTFYTVINNQAWPAGGDAVSDSIVLFILALLPGWSCAAAASVLVAKHLTAFLSGSTRAARTIALVALGAWAFLFLLVLFSWDN